ncbi:MAG: DUF4089 domain-containing protein [Pseudomonadota bacterium]
MSAPAPDAAYLEAVSKLLELEIAPEYREGVLFHLAIAAQMAEALDKAPLDPREQAPLPVYRPPEPC